MYGFFRHNMKKNNFHSFRSCREYRKDSKGATADLYISFFTPFILPEQKFDI